MGVPIFYEPDCWRASMRIDGSSERTPIGGSGGPATGFFAVFFARNNPPRPWEQRPDSTRFLRSAFSSRLPSRSTAATKQKL